ncbi:DNA transposition AAA+ family ATPase [Neisseria sp. HSC-16F19]|nr:AAA family ATPase [Neisseria sp. HSC-16F19]MCP2041442.1 DNA transposition AAA+ family ATPase [Neisseria sp. HSC-16F19]
MKQDLQDYISASGSTQSAVARAIGVTPAVVNQYLQGKYKGDVAAVDRAVGAFLQKQREKAADKKLAVPYVYTTTAKRVRDMLRLAHLEGETVVLYGQAGLGKTRALAAYRADNPDALLLDTDPTYTAKVLLQKLAQMLGADGRGNLSELMEAVVGRLKDSGRIILVDEAENLPLRALECLRRVHDKAGVGLVLAGMPRLLVNLRGKNGELKQLYSRVAFRLDLGDTVPDADLAMIAREALPEPDADTVAALVEAACGNARRLDKLARGVVRLARMNHKAADAAMVRAFAEMLIH